MWNEVIMECKVGVGVGNCPTVAPAVFDPDAGYKAVLPDAGSAEEIAPVEAAGSCPVKAIKPEGEEGNVGFPLAVITSI